MREQMIQQQMEHLQTVQSLTTAFHAQISKLIRGYLFHQPLLQSQMYLLLKDLTVLDILIIKLLHKGTINLNCG